jgi:hypothetical protein
MSSKAKKKPKRNGRTLLGHLYNKMKMKKNKLVLYVGEGSENTSRGWVKNPEESIFRPFSHTKCLLFSFSCHMESVSIEKMTQGFTYCP